MSEADLQGQIDELKQLIDAVAKGDLLKAKASGIRIGSLRIQEVLAGVLETTGKIRLYWGTAAQRTASTDYHEGVAWWTSDTDDLFIGTGAAWQQVGGASGAPPGSHALSGASHTGGLSLTQHGDLSGDALTKHAMGQVSGVITDTQHGSRGAGLHSDSHAAATPGVDAEHTFAGQVLSGVDAAALQKGHIQLAGHLGGTAASPTVVSHAAIGSGDLHPEYQTPAEHTAIGDAAPHHAAITLGADADVLLGLTGQQIDLDPQNANDVFAGPAAAPAADPTFRKLADADIPSAITRDAEHPAMVHTAAQPPAPHGPAQHTEGAAWKLVYQNAAGDEVELALGADGTVLKGEGVAAAPTFGQIDFVALEALSAPAPTPATLSLDRLALTTGVAVYIVSAESGTTDDVDGISGFTESQFLLFRAATGHTLTLKNENAGAAAPSDRIKLWNGLDVIITDSMCIFLYHDDTLDRWIQIAGPLVHTSVMHQSGGSTEIDVTGLWGLLADDQHVIDSEVTAVAVAKSLYDAYTILMATTDNTPVALTIAEQRLVGRITGGVIAALTPAQIMALLSAGATAAFSMNSQKITALAAASVNGDAMRFDETPKLAGDLEGTVAAPTVKAASLTVAGKVELATAAETTTGTDATLAVTPDGLAGSDYGKRAVGILVSDPGGSAITTGDGKVYFRVPSVMNGYNLVAVAASLSTVSSSGIPTVQVRRSRWASATTRTNADMLSTKLTIDASEFDSIDAAAAAVIDAANDDVNTGDHIYIDIDVAGTGAKGLFVELQFQLP